MTTQPREEFFAQIEDVLDALHYDIEKNDGQYLVAYSRHHWDTEHNYSFSANHKRKLSLNYDEDGRIFFGIREDADTRYVFNGEIDHVNDILWIDAKTRILPHKLTPLTPKDIIKFRKEKRLIEKLHKSHLHKLRGQQYELWNTQSSQGDNWVASAASSGSNDRLVSSIDLTTKKITHSWE